MKKIFLFLSLVVLSLTSCTSDDAQNTDTATTAYTGPKTSVVASIDTPVNSNTTAKNVNRGNIFAWVSSINLTATSTAWLYNTSENFTLVGTGGDSAFTIDNVALGANKFTATTTTNTTPVQAFTLVTTGTSSALKTATSAHNPYALYSGETNTNILSTALNVVTLAMTTPNGRVISVFEFDNDAQLRANTKATITATITGPGAGNTTLTSPLFTNTDLVLFEWSDATSLAGKQVTYTIKLYDKANPSVLITSYNVVNPTTVKGSTSISCTYQINRDKVINDAPDEVRFTWQPWVNEECETNYDNDGYNCLGFDRDGRDKDGNNKGGFNKCGWHKAPNVFYNAQQDEDLSDGNSKTKCGGTN
jgi:hypothetical protein